MRTQSLQHRHAHLQTFKPLCRQAFTGEPDAWHALAACEQTWPLTTGVASQRVAVPRYQRVGRPAQDRPPDEITDRIDGVLASRPEQSRRKLHQQSGVILATNPLDSEVLSDDDRLRAYQDHPKIERSLRFLTAPLWMASTRYRKAPQRLMALRRVMTRCLRV